MKKIVALILIVLLAATLLTACGNVKTTVNSKYDDGFAKDYCSDVKTDADGNKSYEFTSEKYKEFIKDYNNYVADDAKQNYYDTTAGNYLILSEDGTVCRVGIAQSHFDELGMDGCKAEAEGLGKRLIKYNMNTKNPTGKMTVIYEKDNGTKEEYLRVEVSAD